VNEFLANTLIAIAGIVVGLLVGWLVGRAHRQDLEAELAAVGTQDSVTDILEVLSAPGILVDGVNNVLRATTSAQVLGFVPDSQIRQPELIALTAAARATGEPTSNELAVGEGDAAEATFVHARAALLADGRVLLTLEDLTESKRLDETRRDFIANISHELKTPIGAISLLSEALLDSDDDPDMAKKFAGDLNREAKRLAALVQDIIQLSRLQGAEVSRSAQVVAIADVIEEAVDRNAVLAAQRDVKIKVDAATGVKVLGDREMLVTAFKNLIENAIVYSDEGSQVGVGVRQKHGVAAIAVADSGVGIAPEHQARIFERFYRADASRSRQTGGTGLGLAIVKHIAIKHRGDVQLFSQPGVGSTFTFRIPIANQQLTTSKDDE
jgi:two-component system sensor histidine kinase SenX3